MGESTLSLKYTDLTGEVGLFLGYGRGTDNGDPAWTDKQKAAIESCVRSGLRQFYFPPPLPGEGVAYDWSFLKPTATMVFASGQSTVALPDDFGGFEGEITVVASTTNQVPWSVELVNEGQVRQRYAEVPTETGRPLIASLQPIKGTSLGKGQRFQLYLFPLADQDYTVQFQYYLLADALSGTFPYAYGGMAHAETILESCLAIAEQRLDDASTVHSMKFTERLAASVNLDRRFKPQTLGYNGDRSDGRRQGLDRKDLYGLGSVTVNGIQY